ncbi:tetrapyrrole methylase [Desarmillaria tabescens]|uniref:Tetrapyrrole methylase n=1 Tax=Armillaria tabescens TaxID=1929756 RepID=A0AA39KG59_ARMTA|nr:tetrapyrrole methylase [Desarmillaria tabescens]KAK0459345.1 tetrapyrrole methylase [Desarmillaria tabescens]
MRTGWTPLSVVLVPVTRNVGCVDVSIGWHESRKRMIVIHYNISWADVCKEAFYEQLLILADRETCRKRRAMKYWLLQTVVRDPFRATTHTDVILRARTLGNVIHNVSIMNAVGTCYLQLYNFCQTTSLVFFTDPWNPDSLYDTTKENADLDLSTLVLLDIKAKKQSEANLARCQNIYERPRYMSIRQAVSQLIESESLRRTGTLSPDTTTLVIALSCVVGGSDNKSIISCTLTGLVNLAEDAFGDPLHNLVIVDKQLSPSRGRVYGCALD